MHFRVLTVAEVLWVIALTSAAALFMGGIAVEGVNFGWDARIQVDVTTRHWHFSKWLIISNFLQWGSANLFQIATALWLGISVAGALRAAVYLCAVTNIALQGLLNIVPVRAAMAIEHGGKIPFLAELRRATLLGGAGIIVVSAVVASVPEFWLQAAFGEAFSGYGTIVRWYALLQPLIFLEVPLAAGLRAVEDSRPFFFEYLAANLITLVLIFPLMIQFGVIGVMINISITWPLQILILGLALRRRLQSVA
jgi:O-antigen/teichoic acid export membrane protein